MLATPAPPTSPQFTAFISAPSPIPPHPQLIQIPGNAIQIPGNAVQLSGNAGTIMAAVTAAATPEPAKAAAVVATAPTAAPVASSARDLPGNGGGGSGSGEECKIGIRRVTKYDFKSVVELFRTFDREKYTHLRADAPNNNNNNASNGKDKTLVGLRIDDKGGIYLQPLIDTNSAYFKCFVAEEKSTGALIGYVLFFHTLDADRAATMGQHSAAEADPIAVVEDLYVAPEFRGRKIATQLFRQVLKDSLERGCFSCECLLIPSNADGVRFWKRRVGENKIRSLVNDHKSGTGAANNGRQVSNGGAAPNNSSAKHELIIELNRGEMRTFYEKTSLNPK